MKHLTRLFAILLVAGMLLSALPATAFAEEVHSHPVCGKTHTDIGDHTGSCGDIVWTPVHNEADLTNALQTGGNYYLAESFTISTSNNKVASGVTVNLCLNGKTLTRDTYGITVYSATLNICDCVGTGNLTGNTATDAIYLYIRTTATLNLYGGNISGNSIGNGGAVAVAEGTSFHMYGGNISNNSASHGAVNVVAGEFHMHGGKISNNTGNNYGAVNVTNGGSMIMENGAVIEDNTSQYGCGGIRMGPDTTVTINGGNIARNESGSHGGGIHMDGGTLTINGGTITGNIADTNGGGISSITNNPLGYDGGTVIINGGTITGNSDTDGNVDNVYLGSGKTIAVGSTLANNTKIGVTMANGTGTFTSGGAAYKSNFISDNSAYEVAPDGNNLKLFSPVYVTGVIVSAINLELYVGNSTIVAATVYPMNATNQELEWKAADDSVISLTPDGSSYVVKGVKAGATSVTVTAKDGSGKSAAFSVSVSYLPAPANPYAVNGGQLVDGTYWVKAGTSATIIPKTGYTVSKTFGSNYANEVTVSETGSKIYLKQDDTGALTDAISIDNVRFDGNAPTGKIEIAGKGTWQTLINAITFDLFFKDAQSMKVTAMDAESGLAKIEYFLSEEDLLDGADGATLEQRIDNRWTQCQNGAQIPLAMNQTNVLYVKLTDRVGNVSYLSSDGIVMDNTAPEFVGIQDGGAYYGRKIFKVLDDNNLLTFYVDGVDVTDQTEGDDEYTVPADNQSHILRAVDKAGNVTEYTVAFYQNYTVTYQVGEQEVSKQTVGHGKDADAPAVPAKEGYTGAWDGDGKNITADTTINAVYTLNKYTVTYKTDGEVVKTLTVEHGKDAAAPAVPAKEGYTGAWDGDGKNITADTTINAVYTINKYTVTYQFEDKVLSTETVEWGKNATLPELPKVDGYTGAWDKDGKNITADTTITAVYTKNEATEPSTEPSTEPPTEAPTTKPTEKPTNPVVPDTGDTASLGILCLLMLASLGGVAALVLRKKTVI